MEETLLVMVVERVRIGNEEKLCELVRVGNEIDNSKVLSCTGLSNFSLLVS